MTVATCTRCRKTKPANDFYRNSRARNGLTSYCKSCSKQAASARYWKTRTSGQPRKPMADRTCQHCNSTYTPRGNKQRWCTPGCADRARGTTKLKPVQCRCGKTFTPKSRQHVNCSQQCAERITGICSDCGNTFTKARGSQRRFDMCTPCARIDGQRTLATQRIANGEYTPKEKWVPATRECRYCGSQFTELSLEQKYCSARCRHMWRSRGGAKRRSCRDCGTDLGLWGKARTCPDCLQIRKRERTRAGGDYRKRARRAGVKYEYINRQAIFERDGWRCHLCWLKVDQRLEYPHPRSVSLDHIIPMSLGGGHTRENVATSHLECNLGKSNRGSGDQLALIG